MPGSARRGWFVSSGGGWAGSRAQPLLRSGRCLSYGHGITYWPLGEVLKEHFGILESDPAEVAARAGRPTARTSASRSASAPPRGHAPADRARPAAHDPGSGFLQELTAERPAAVLVEDLHWADGASCAICCDASSERVADAPLLLVLTARPELLDQRPGWAGAPGRTASSRLRARCPTAEAQRAARRAARAASRRRADPRAGRRVRAEGNPFFVEELIATLADRGVLGRAEAAAGRSVDARRRISGAGYRPGRARRAHRPVCPAREKAALQTAAVIGRVFWSGPVCELVEGTGPGLRSA